MGQKSTKDEYERAVKASLSIAGVCRFLGIKPSGGNYRIVHTAIQKYSLSTQHFTGQGWNTKLKFKEKAITEILKKDSSYQSYKLKKRLIREGLKGEICESCKLQMWQGSIIPLELHHINGDNTDNRIENLMLLCPNCHALTEYYRGKNKKNSKY